ncbi:MAG: META domain-containing protein [Roseiflexaceae bacterium]|jgi:heat shock protein HslJ
MKYMLRVFMLVLVVLMIVSCGQAPSPLNNTDWQLVALNGNMVEEQMIPSLRFADGKIEGNGFCNSYSAEYQLNGDALTITPVVATEMACEDMILNIVEREYFTTLNAVTRYAIEGNELRFFDLNGVVVVLLRKST